MRISEMRNLGPQMERWLAEIDIHGDADLRRAGAIAAWHRLRFAFGKRVTLNALFAMEAALLDCDWRALPAEVKDRLRQAAARSDTAIRSKPARPIA